MTKAGASKAILPALILSIAPTTLLAQQSTQQIVRAGQPQTQEQKANAEPQPEQKPVAEAVSKPVVVPPAPIIVKRNPNAIGIPVAVLQAQAAAGSSTNQVVGPEAPPPPLPGVVVLPPAPGTATAPPAPDVVAVPPAAAPKFEERPVVMSDVRVSSSFGYRRDPFTGRARFHSGVDMKAAWGDPVGASYEGTVEFAGWYSGYGRLVVVNHGGGLTTYYAHLSSFAVAVGQRVKRGQVVGHAGSSGRSTSPHLHYELRVNGRPVNPLQPVALDPPSETPQPTPPETPANGATAPGNTIRQIAN